MHARITCNGRLEHGSTAIELPEHSYSPLDPITSIIDHCAHRCYRTEGGSEYWVRDDMLDRAGAPAIRYHHPVAIDIHPYSMSTHDEWYYTLGQLDRADGPAVSRRYVEQDGRVAGHIQRWFCAGVEHNDDGPAYVDQIWGDPDSWKYSRYVVDGRPHRIDGPAVIDEDIYDNREWWIHGRRVSPIWYIRMIAQIQRAWRAWRLQQIHRLLDPWLIPDLAHIVATFCLRLKLKNNVALSLSASAMSSVSIQTNGPTAKFTQTTITPDQIVKELDDTIGSDTWGVYLRDGTGNSTKVYFFTDWVVSCKYDAQHGPGSYWSSEEHKPAYAERTRLNDDPSELVKAMDEGLTVCIQMFCDGSRNEYYNRIGDVYVCSTIEMPRKK